MQKLKVINKYCFYLGFLLIFLEAYQIFSIPLSWIGLSLIFLYSFNFKNIFTTNPLLKVLLIGFIILIIIDLSFIASNPQLLNIQYFVLRIFNIISFIVLFILFKNNDVIQDLQLDTKIKNFIIIFSVLSIYIYFAQIFDLFEPLRNRSNTSVYSNSLQTTFWPEASHRALGTFREPSYLVSYFLPLIYLRIKSVNKLSITTLILCSTIIGLAKSDFSLVFCAFLLLIEIIEFISRKKIDYQIIIFSIIVISFSQINIVECNLNPDSKDCLNYFEEKEEANIFNDDIVFNDSNNNFIEENSSLIDFDNERFAIYRFVLDSFDNIDHKGVLYANIVFQEYSSKLTQIEMYLTNRTQPNYLLDNFPTQNFGTGRYSLIRYPINLQNKLVFYYVSYGPLVLVIIILLLLNLIKNFNNNFQFKYFIVMILFLILSPIEELNSYFGFILGYAFHQFVD
jgi:hypothetical protein|tara:strand:- start:327 stop:1685 length:1359 start_codon:yes stop_codon:yes gene_type:complete